jgi:hypothetical protein
LTHSPLCNAFWHGTPKAKQRKTESGSSICREAEL